MLMTIMVIKDVQIWRTYRFRSRKSRGWKSRNSRGCRHLLPAITHPELSSEGWKTSKTPQGQFICVSKCRAELIAARYSSTSQYKTVDNITCFKKVSAITTNFSWCVLLRRRAAETCRRLGSRIASVLKSYCAWPHYINWCVKVHKGSSTQLSIHKYMLDHHDPLTMVKFTATYVVGIVEQLWSNVMR